MQEFIQDYAESPDDVVRSDIFNILEAAREDKREKLARWLMEKRPDLADEIDACMSNIREDEMSSAYGESEFASMRYRRTPGASDFDYE